MRAKRGLSEELGRRLLHLVQPSRAEAACINYDVHRSDEDPELWCVYENWQSAEELAAHFGLPHMQAFVAEVPALVEGGLDLRRFSMISKPTLWRL
jgi:quinol monooxygenase YgiN